MSTLTFTVPGRARGQGSKRHIGGGAMIEASRHVKQWRCAVTAAARQAAADKGWDPAAQACSVMISISRARPATHYIGRDQSRGLRPTAPKYCTATPDVDKVARAVLDALTIAGVLSDDRYVDMLTVSRGWAAAGASDSTDVTVWTQP